MSNIRLIRNIGVCCLFAAAIGLFGDPRKPGLWEFTTTTTWQKTPIVPGQESERLKGGTRTSQVCLTQEMIEQMGALLPQSHGQCTLENKHIEPGQVTADYVCSGLMTGRGALKSVWSDPNHMTGTVHFTGSLRVGPDEQPIEWTTESHAVFKSIDCGSVKPLVSGKPRR